MSAHSPTPPPAATDGETAYRLHRRFDRIARLVGDQAMSRLFGAHVMVVGLGGVGSFAVEALARSGVGTLSLVDFDRVCVTNTNRQLQALAGAVARPKAATLAERVAQINPQAVARPLAVFYSERTSAALLDQRPDFVVDAIDNIKAKCHLLAACRTRGLPVVSSMGAAGRIDPTRIRTADLGATRVDPFAMAVRHVLRKKFGFPSAGAFAIPAVYSEERPAEPRPLGYDGEDGFRCVCPGGTNDVHSCEERRVIYGTAGFVTGAFGLACASVVVRALSEGGGA
jgi:tRNA A37 threonylcarbamoyladenosine dehydratase